MQLAFALTLAMAPASSTPSRVAMLADEVLRSTEDEWREEFALRNRPYRSPRLLIVDLPRRHRARGSGYANGIVILDERQLEDVFTVFRSAGRTLVAFVIAHEIAHHIQWQSDDRRFVPPGRSKELQADCIAGYWLTKANTRMRAATGQDRFGVANLASLVPRLLGALNVLDGRFGPRGLPDPSMGHGTGQERSDAVMKGLRASRLSACGVQI